MHFPAKSNAWGRAKCTVACLWLLLPFAVDGAEQATSERIRIYDGPGGATCNFFDAALRSPWMARGGDWLDANGVLHGPEPYAVVDVPAVHKPPPVDFDVTHALRDAMEEGNFAGFVISGAKGGEVVLFSRESKDPSLHPQLVLELASETPVRLAPRADTYVGCSSTRSLGQQEVIRVGGQSVSAIIDFDIPAAVNRQIVSATLRLHPKNLYGRAGRFSLYRLGGRAVEPASPRQEGLSARVGEEQLADNPDVLFVERFEKWNWSKGWSILGPKNNLPELVAAGPGFAELEGKALRVMVPRNTSLGLDLRYRFREKLGFEPEEAYLRYYARFSNTWETPVDGGKLPGFSGTYGKAGWGGRTPNGYNGWNARMLFMKQPPEGHPHRHKVTVGTEASIPEVPGVQTEAHFTWAKGHAGVLDKSRWYSIEQYVKLNTPGRNDGIIRGWVDGRLAFERTNVVFRHTADLKIEEAWMNIYHGGTQHTPRDITMYIDNLVIAKQYIGPMKDSRSRVSLRP